MAKKMDVAQLYQTKIEKKQKQMHKCEKTFACMVLLYISITILLILSSPYFPSKKEFQSGTLNAIAVNIQGENWLLPLDSHSVIDNEAKPCDKIMFAGIFTYCDKKFEQELNKSLINIQHKNHVSARSPMKSNMILRAAQEAALILKETTNLFIRSIGQN